MTNKDTETHHIKNSTLMLRADYDRFMENLKIYFRSGEVYDFVGVPSQIFEELKKTESAGKFFHSKIKPHYEHLKLTKKVKEKTSVAKKAKKIIEENFGSKSWFQGVRTNKEDGVIVYVTDITNMEAVKNTIPVEFDVKFDFKVVNK